MKSAIFVINLDRSQNRLDRMQAQAAELGIELHRIPAVDGRALKQSELDQFYSPKLNRRGYHKHLTVGEIGCYISHIKAWQQIIEQNLDYAVILEDDTLIGPKFLHALKTIAFVKQEWDVIKLGAVKRRPILESHWLGALTLCRYQKVPVSAFAQVVSRRGAQRLIDSRSVFGRPVDIDLQYVWENDLEVFGLEPFPVAVRNDDSEVGAKPKRTLFGENSCFRLYHQRMLSAWHFYFYNFRRHGIIPTLTAKRFQPAPDTSSGESNPDFLKSRVPTTS